MLKAAKSQKVFSKGSHSKNQQNQCLSTFHSTYCEKLQTRILLIFSKMGQNWKYPLRFSFLHQNWIKSLDIFLLRDSLSQTYESLCAFLRLSKVSSRLRTKVHASQISRFKWNSRIFWKRKLEKKIL